MKKYFLMMGPTYYGVAVLMGEKAIMSTTIENEAIITLEGDVEDSVDYLKEKKGIKAVPILIEKGMTSSDRKELSLYNL